jgi:BirA family biotin operon repressor/biotin-[acetyl-CoA-carboxylase] ligase
MGKNLVFMPECHSTNTFALELCQREVGPAEGTVIVTANQFAGRGQRANTWIAEPGKNLTFSIILYPSFLSIQRQFYLNIVVGLGICGYLRSKGCVNARVKWPNDIYVGDRKISGVLIESQIAGKRINSSILGIGLNINQVNFSIKTATSLSIETDMQWGLSDELEKLLVSIESEFLRLQKGEFELLRQDYLNALYWINEEHTFESGSEKFKGIITGIAEGGQLVIRVGTEQRVFGNKEVRFVD